MVPSSLHDAKAHRLRWPKGHAGHEPQAGLGGRLDAEASQDGDQGKPDLDPAVMEELLREKGGKGCPTQ